MSRRQPPAPRADPETTNTPANLDAEKAVLGCALLRPVAADTAIDLLQDADFWRDAHQRIFRAMQAVRAKGMTVDLLTVNDVLVARGELDMVGGPAYVASMTDGVPSTSNIDSYCALLVDMRQRRDLLDVSRRLAAAVTLEPDVATLAGQAEGWLAETMRTRGSRELQPQRDILSTFIPKLEARMAGQAELRGITSGFKQIDDLTRGFHPEDLTILAARPSMGKSSLMLNMASAAAAAGAHVAVFSLEMSKERLEYRLVAAKSEVSMFRIQKGWLQEEHVQRISAALLDLSAHPLYIDDTPGLTVPQMKAQCSALRATRGLDLVFVDYVQLMRPKVERADNRQQDVAEISYDLKNLARKLRVPVVALSQLSREVERRANKRPVLSDLRESGSLEQDADNVAFIYRPEAASDMGATEYILAKARDGDVGVVNLTFKREHVRFYDEVAPRPMRVVPKKVATAAGWERADVDDKE